MRVILTFTWKFTPAMLTSLQVYHPPNNNNDPPSSLAFSFITIYLGPSLFPGTYPSLH